MSDQEKRMFVLDEKVVKDSDTIPGGKVITVGVPSQEELEARGVWEDVKDGIVGSWEMFKNMTLDSEKQRQTDNKSDHVLSLYEIEKTLDKHASKQGYSNEQQLTLAQFLLAFHEVAKKYSIAEKNALCDLIPQGPGTNAFKVITTSMIAGIEQINKKGSVFTIRDRFDNTMVIEYKSNKSNYIFSIRNENFEKIAKTSNRQSANIRKMFNFLLTKANEQNFNNLVEFDLQELIDRGIYNSKDTAYRGAKDCIDSLMAFEVEGTTRRGKKEIANKKSYVFVSRDITYNNCTVQTMPGMLEGLTGYYSYLPRWAYRLKSKPFLLLDYIYSMARQNTNRLLKEGHFNISLRAVNTELGQPGPDDTHRHTESIIDPILKAIEEVEENSLNDLKITPIFDHDYKNAYSFLKGYLQIELDKQTHESLTNKAKSWQKKIRQAKIKAAKKEG